MFTADWTLFNLHLVAGLCLKVDPAERASVADVLGQVAAIAETRGFSLKEPLNLEGKKLDAASVAQYQQQSSMQPQMPQSGEIPTLLRYSFMLL